MVTNNAERVWSFRIERYDPSGDRLAPVPVEMRGTSFSGTVSNGDEVRVNGRWSQGTLRIHELDNLTTGAKIHSNSHPVLQVVACSVIAIAFFAFFVFLGITFVMSVFLGRDWP